MTTLAEFMLSGSEELSKRLFPSIGLIEKESPTIWQAGGMRLRGSFRFAQDDTNDD